MDPVAILTTATTGLGTDYAAVAAIGLGVGAAVYVLKRGWALIKGFGRG